MKKINIVLFIFIITNIFFVNLSYAAFNENLYVSGEGVLRKQTNVRVNGIVNSGYYGEAIENFNPNYNVDETNVSVNLPTSDSRMTYTVTIKNYGDKVYIPQIDVQSNVSSNVIITISDGETSYNLPNEDIDYVLNPAEEKTYTLTISNKSGTTNNNVIVSLKYYFVMDEITNPLVALSNDERYIEMVIPGTSTFGVDHYEYYISESMEDPISSTEAHGVTNGLLDITSVTYEHFYVWYRTVSTKGNKSEWSNRAEVAYASYTSQGFVGPYDGNEHTISVSGEDITVKYGTTEGTYNLDTPPVFTDAGKHTVYFKVSKPGYRSAIGSETVLIAAFGIGENYFETLAEAALNVPNNNTETTINVYSDYSDSELVTFSENTNVNLNLNNKSILYESEDTNLCYINNYGNLTINTNGGITSNIMTLCNEQNAEATISGGSISSSGDNAIKNTGNMIISGSVNVSTDENVGETRPAVLNKNGGELIINGGTFISTGANPTIANESTMTLNNGTVTSANIAVGTGTNAISNINGGTISGNLYALSTIANGTTTISGGTLTSSGSNTVYNSGVTNIGGSAKIESTVEGGAYIIYNGSTGEMEISGGEVTATTNAGISNNNLLTISGSAKISNTSSGYAALYTQANGTTTITGGTITASSYAVNTKANGTTNISGGTLTSSGSNTIYNYGVTNISGTAKIESTVNGGTYIISNGSTGEMEISGGEVTATISAGINNNNLLTISGSAKISNTSSEYAAIETQANATTSITGGTISASFYAINTKANGTTTISGGTLSSSDSNTIYNIGTTNISGGTITNSNSSTIYNWGITNISGSAKISNTSSKKTAVFTLADATTTITGGTITANSYAVNTLENGTTNISGGTITSSGSNTIYNYGVTNISGSAKIESTVDGGSFIILNGTTGEMEINGGEVTATTSAGIGNNHLLTINGSAKISNTSSGYSAVYTQANATTSITGGTISAVSYAINTKANGTTNISGGTISAVSYAVNTNENGTTNISGGTLTSSASNTIYNLGVTNISGTAKIQSTVNGSKFIILNSSTGEMEISGGEITSTTNAGIGNNHLLTIKDTANINITSIYAAIETQANGTTTISGGTINAVSYALYTQANGTTTITGGTITASSYAVNTQANGTTTISGGTLTSSGLNTIYNLGVTNISGSAKIESTVEGGTYIINNGSTGEMEISGGEVTATTNAGISNNNLLTISGSAKISNTSSGYAALYTQANGTTTITGGTITASSYAVNTKANGTANISGGTLTSSGNNTIYNLGVTNISGSAKISNTSNGKYIILNGTTGEMNISGGEIEITTVGINNTYLLTIGENAKINNSNSSYAAIYTQANATTTINGGTISASSYAINVVQNGTANISGGTLSSSNSHTIYNSGTTNISGTAKIESTVNSGKYIISNGTTGEMNISGGEVNVTTGAGISNNNLLTISGSAKINSTSRYDAVYTQANGTTTITGGTITANSIAINNKANGTTNISGGTLTSSGNSTIYNLGTTNISGTAKIQSTVEGDTCIINNGSTGEMEISGGEVTATTSAGISNNNLLTISGSAIVSNTSSGYTALYTQANATTTITGGTISAISYVLQNFSGGTLNISGGTIAEHKETTDGQPAIYNYGTATISGTASLSSETGYGVIMNASSGTLTMNGGTIASSRSSGIQNKNILTINDGTISAAGGGVITTHNSATTTINGGTIIKSVQGEAGTTTINNGSVTSIYIRNTAVVDIEGGTINGMIYAIGGTTNITGGSITGQIDVWGNGIVNMSGGRVVSNHSTDPAFNNAGTSTISGTAYIESTTNNGLYNESTGTVTIDGGTIIGADDYYDAYNDGGTATYISGTVTDRNF